MSRARSGFWWAIPMLVACSNSGVASPDGTDEGAGRSGESDSEPEQRLGGGASASMSSSSELDDDANAGVTDEANGGTGAGDEGGPDDAAGPDDAEDAAGGAAGASGASGAEGGTGGTTGAESPCPKPAGEDISASPYTPPATAAGCDFGTLGAFSAFEVSATLASEAEFREFFECPEQAVSGIDFGAQRLRVSVVREAGFVAPTREHAVSVGGVITLAFALPAYCGGAFPPTALALTLLPSGNGEVREELCRLGDCGAGGFPP